MMIVKLKAKYLRLEIIELFKEEAAKTRRVILFSEKFSLMPLFIRITVVEIQYRLAYMKIYIWNDGEMSEGMKSTDKLFMRYSSKPYNPWLANVFS